MAPESSHDSRSGKPGYAVRPGSVQAAGSSSVGISGCQGKRTDWQNQWTHVNSAYILYEHVSHSECGA